MVSKSQEEIAREKFELAAKEFDFVFHSPYALTETLSVFGYIKNYGSKNGAVICLTAPPDFTTNKEVTALCKQKKIFVSFINIEPLLGEYKASYFREMLRDWGKY